MFMFRRKELISRISRTNRFFSTKEDIILKIFNKTPIDKELETRKLLEKAYALNEEINYLEKNLYECEKQARLIDRKLAEMSAKTPLDEAEYVKNLILNGFTTCILGNFREIKDGPLPEYNQDVFKIIEPICEAFEISCGISQGLDPHEKAEYLHVSFPESIGIKKEIPTYENKHYNEWLNGFKQAAAHKIAAANQRVRDDYNYLQKQLYEPVQAGADNIFVECKPCPAALKRFKEFAGSHNLEVSIHGDLVTLKKTEINTPSCRF